MKRVLLVAKPWRGGLAHYIFRALQAEFGAGAHWLSTAPAGFSEFMAYRRDRSAWRHHLVEKISRDQSDLVLFINYLPEFQSLVPGSRNVIWLTDDPRPVVPRLDAFGTILLSDPGYLDECRGLLPRGKCLEVLPFGCDPEFHQPGDALRGGRMCFIANRDHKRDLHLRTLFDSGRSLHVYGNYFGRSRLFWQHPFAFRPAVSFSQMGSVYREYGASLNVHAEVVRGGTNMRTFECAAFGVPQLVEYRPGIENYFVPDDEILVYDNLDELCAKYDRITGDARLRARLADKSRQRAIQCHTYRQRVHAIMNMIN